MSFNIALDKLLFFFNQKYRHFLISVQKHVVAFILSYKSFELDNGDISNVIFTEKNIIYVQFIKKFNNWDRPEKLLRRSIL